MQLESNEIVYDDGRHNAFTALTRWRDAYWLAFRSGADHRSHDGRVVVMRSQDLRQWSAPITAVDTSADERDPVLYVWNDHLFVAAASQRRTFADEAQQTGPQVVSQIQSSCSASADGVTWSSPWIATQPYHFIWWAVARPEGVYATQRMGKKWTENGQQRREDAATFWYSGDGRHWQRLSTISDTRCATETAFDFLPDGRVIAFVRHDADHYPEIKIAEPPYTAWHTLLDFPFKCNGPALKCIGNRVVISARAFFEDDQTPLVTDAMRPRKRGLLVLAVDVAARRLVPELMLPHSTGPEPRADGENFPDISYADMVDLGDGRFAMSYYEGYKQQRAWIRLAVIDANAP